MKTLLIIPALLLLVNCGNPEPAVEASTPFPFVLEGFVENGEGKVLALIPQDGNMEERLTAKIVEGKYRFEGESDFIQSADLRFEEDIVNLAGSYASSMVILEPGVTTFNINIKELEGRSRFSNFGFEQGENNLNLLSFIIDYEEAIGDGSWVFGDNIKSDSMVRNVYPVARSNAFNLLDQQFASGQHGLNAIILDKIIVSRLNSKGMFNREHLTTEQKDKVIGYFTVLDSLEINPVEYQGMQETVLHLHDAVQPQAFQDINLYTVNGWNGKLSEKVAAHDYSMLYFWFTECAPCRAFNQQMKSEYATLQAKGIEIIAINVDDSKAKWENTTRMDSIPWTNLYAGMNAGAERKYNINGFPKKVAYDRKLDFVNVKLKTMEEILDWANEID